MPIFLQFDGLFKAGNQHCFINNQQSKLILRINYLNLFYIKLLLYCHWNLFYFCAINLIIELMEITIENYNDLQPSVNSYEPPKIEILEIMVEKGFADSTTNWNPGNW